MGDSGRPLWQVLVSFGLPLSVILVAIPLLTKGIREARSERTRLLQRDPTRTSRVSRELRRGRQVDGGDLPLAQAVVDGTTVQLRLALMLLLLSATSVTSGATSEGPVRGFLYATAGVTLVATTFSVAITVAMRRGGRRNGLRPSSGGLWGNRASSR